MSLEIIDWMVVITMMPSGTKEVCHVFYPSVKESETVRLF